MEITIVYKENFENQINELINLLYFENYFGFEEYAVNYADKIYDFIYKNIQFPISKIAPISHQKFGKKFIKYQANKQTTWYIFFDQKGDKFLVNHIINNHSHHFPELM